MPCGRLRTQANGNSERNAGHYAAPVVEGMPLTSVAHASIWARFHRVQRAPKWTGWGKVPRPFAAALVSFQTVVRPMPRARATSSREMKRERLWASCWAERSVVVLSVVGIKPPKCVRRFGSWPPLTLEVVSLVASTKSGAQLIDAQNLGSLFSRLALNLLMFIGFYGFPRFCAEAPHGVCCAGGRLRIVGIKPVGRDLEAVVVCFLAVLAG